MRVTINGQYKAERSVLALGMFDGMHLGHQALFREAKALAVQSQAPLVACTFATHPMTLTAPHMCPPMLTTLKERECLMKTMGVDIVYAPVFDEHIMNRRPADYIDDLCDRFNPRFVVVGYNYTFGRAALGTPLTLAALGKAYGFETRVTPRIALGGQEISSSAIRMMLSRGETLKAMRLLGRPYARYAELHGGERGVFALAFLRDGKQDTPPGLYRVLLSRDHRRVPAALHLRREERGSAILSSRLSINGETEILFIAGKRRMAPSATMPPA